MPIFGNSNKNRVYLRRKSLRLQNLTNGLVAGTALTIGASLIYWRGEQENSTLGGEKVDELATSSLIWQ